MARLEQYRIEHPGQGPTVEFSVHEEIRPIPISFASQLESWSNEFEKSFPQPNNAIREKPDSTRIPLNKPEENMLTTFLSRVREIQDYKVGGETRKAVILCIENMLQLASTSARFKDALVILLNQASESCGDRVQIVFNDIEILYQFHCKELSSDEFKQLTLREGRYEYLRQHALEIYHKRGGDDIEIILAFHINLRERLNLPISTEHMLYQNLSRVTTEMVVEAKNKIEAMTEIQVLAYSPHWLAKMRESYAKEHAKIEEEFWQLFEQAREYFGPGKNGALLEGNDQLANLIQSAPLKEYTTVARVISDKRNEEIARLGFTV